MTITLETIRAAGGIVHSDGNIFFRDISMLEVLAGAAPAAVAGPAIKVPEDWMEHLGFELDAPADGVWMVIDDTGARREANLTERILWKELIAIRAAIQDAALAPAAPALEAPAAPAGWKLVPEKPTDAMLGAAQKAWLADPLRRSSTVYAAALAAAPQAHAAPGTPPLTPDEARWAARSADNMRGPSDTTSGTEYVMAGAMALAAKLAAAPQAPAEPVAGNWVAASDVDRLVRELDAALHGEADAAPQASLCDIVGLTKAAASKLGRPVLAAPAAPVLVGDGQADAYLAEPGRLAALARSHPAGLVRALARALLAAPAAPAVDAWLQPDDMAALQRFHETAEDDESYDIGKEAVARLCAFGCLQSHSFGRYSTTDFGDYLLDTWAGARTLPFTTAAEREALAAQAAAKGEHGNG